MTSPQHFSKREEIELKKINFDEIQNVISEVSTYLSKKTYKSQTIDFDNGQGINFEKNLKELTEKYSEKGLKPERISSNFVQTRPNNKGSRLILLDLWVKHKNLGISVGVQNGNSSDIDWAKSKIASVKTLIEPLALGDVKQKDINPSELLSKNVPSKDNKTKFDWRWWFVTLILLLTLFVTWLIYKKS